MESWYSKVADVCEALDWRVSTPKENDSCWEFEKYSPAGEDFCFSIIAKNLAELKGELQYYYENFDREDHVYELLEAKRNGFRGVPDLDTLVEDSQAIEDMLEELAMEVTKIK